MAQNSYNRIKKKDRLIYDRDYEKEVKWNKEKYRKFELRLDRRVAEKFEEQLKKDKLGFTEWVKERVYEYLQIEDIEEFYKILNLSEVS